MRVWWAIGLGGCAIAAACSSFTGTGATDEDDAGTPDGGGVAAGDGGPTEIQDGASFPPEAGTAIFPCAPLYQGNADSAYGVLSIPPRGQIEFPFQIATDSKVVFWAAQYQSGAFTEDDAYNGHAVGRIYRIAKDTSSTMPDLIADNQSQVTSVAVDGDFLYWVTFNQGANSLYQVKRDCTAPCTPIAVPAGDLPIGNAAVARIFVPVPGVLVYSLVDSSFEIVSLGTTRAINRFIAAQAGDPSWAVANGAFYEGTNNGPGVGLVTKLGDAVPLFTPNGSLPQTDPVVALATDCTTTYAYGSAHSKIYSAVEATWKPFADAGLTSVFAMALDANNIYVAQANAGGVTAFDRTTAASHSVYQGNVFAMMADPNGVYWGEHAKGIGGKIYTLRKPP